MKRPQKQRRCHLEKQLPGCRWAARIRQFGKAKDLEGALATVDEAGSPDLFGEGRKSEERLHASGMAPRKESSVTGIIVGWFQFLLEYHRASALTLGFALLVV